MSEKEILNRLNSIIYASHTVYFKNYELMYQDVEAIQGLLDLYTHKKGRVEELKQELLEEKEKNKNSVSKDKIRKRYEQLNHYDYIEIKELLKLLEEGE